MTEMTSESINIYWAGGLFNHKELLGNLQLGTAVEEVSGGKYHVYFPQDTECETARDIQQIRNRDLLGVLQSDVILANFDGTDLDSGTVVEFCFAKSLDIPAVLLRTDFRNCGDSPDAPWNLMCSGWSRTKTLWLNSMADYHQHLDAGSRAELMNGWLREMAGKIIAALDDVRSQPQWLEFEHAQEHYRRIIRAAGNGFEDWLPDDALKAILDGKRRKGL